MAQLIPIGQMGAAGRQIVETAVNPLTVYADARQKAEEVAQTRQLGEQRLEAGRNALAEYQREQRVRSLSQRAMSGDAEARQALMTEAPEVLEANIKRVQGALKDNAPTLLPVVGRAVQMAQDGATPEQIHQYMRQQDTGALDLIFGPAGGFGVEDATPDALMQFGEQLAATREPANTGQPTQHSRLLDEIAAAERAGDTERAAYLRKVAEKEVRPPSEGGGRAPTNPERAAAILRNPNGHLPEEVTWARRTLEGGGGGGVQFEQDENGNLRVSVGGPGLSTPEKNRIDQQYGALEQLIPQFAEYGEELRAGVPRNAAGLVGQIHVSARGLASQLGGAVPFSEWVAKQMKARGITGTRDAERISVIRRRAELLGRQMLPLFEPGGRYSNQDAIWAREALALLNNTGSVEEAVISYELLRSMLLKKHETLRQARLGNGYDMRPMGEREGAPRSTDPRQDGMRPVVPPQGGAAPSNRRPANWSQMTPAQKAAWLRGN